MSWVADHLGDILWYAGQHTLLAGIPLIVGLLLALPLGWLARRHKILYPPLMTLSGTPGRPLTCSRHRWH